MKLEAYRNAGGLLGLLAEDSHRGRLSMEVRFGHFTETVFYKWSCLIDGQLFSAEYAVSEHELLQDSYLKGLADVITQTWQSTNEWKPEE